MANLCASCCTNSYAETSITVITSFANHLFMEKSRAAVTCGLIFFHPILFCLPLSVKRTAIIWGGQFKFLNSFCIFKLISLSHTNYKSIYFYYLFIFTVCHWRLISTLCLNCPDGIIIASLWDIMPWTWSKEIITKKKKTFYVI